MGVFTILQGISVSTSEVKKGTEEGIRVPRHRSQWRYLVPLVDYVILVVRASTPRAMHVRSNIFELPSYKLANCVQR